MAPAPIPPMGDCPNIPADFTVIRDSETTPSRTFLSWSRSLSRTPLNSCVKTRTIFFWLPSGELRVRVRTGSSAKLRLDAILRMIESGIIAGAFPRPAPSMRTILRFVRKSLKTLPFISILGISARRRSLGAISGSFVKITCQYSR